MSQRSNDYFAPTVDCNALNARQRAQRNRARAVGTPDNLQCLSGAPPDSQAGPHVRAPTVRTQRPGDVAGAPDSVRWHTGLSGAPYDSSLHQRSPATALNARQSAQRSGTREVAHRTLYSTCPVCHRTSRRAQKTELQRSTPTAFGDVAVAPDCPVRHRTDSLTKRLVWWLGL